MKIGERGQVTIPKPFRERFGLSHSTEVEFVAEKGELILRKKKFHSENAVRSAKMKKWIGCLDDQPEDVDQFLDDIRGPFVEK